MTQKSRNIKKSLGNSEKSAKEANDIDPMAYNVSFGLHNILKGSDVKTFALNVETGTLQFVKPDGTLYIRSNEDSLRTVDQLISEMSTPFNFNLNGSSTGKDDLKFVAEWQNKVGKSLQAKDKSIANFLHFLTQHVHNLPENPPARNNCIFKNCEEYHNAFSKYLESIDTVENFTIFHGAIAIDLKTLNSVPSGAPASIIQKIIDNSNFGPLAGMSTSVEVILNSPENQSLDDYFLQPEEERPRRIKLATRSLSAHIWYSISSFSKDQVSQEVSRRRQLRFLISMLESYHKLEMYCALKERKQGITIKSQVTKKIIKRSDGQLNNKELTLLIQRARRIQRLLHAVNNSWKVLDSVENLSPSYFTSNLNCLNFEIWLEVVKTGKIITFGEAENKYRQYKQFMTTDRIDKIKKAFEDAGEEIELSFQDFED